MKKVTWGIVWFVTKQNKKLRTRLVRFWGWNRLRPKLRSSQRSLTKGKIIKTLKRNYRSRLQDPFPWRHLFGSPYTAIPRTPTPSQDIQILPESENHSDFGTWHLKWSRRIQRETNKQTSKREKYTLSYRPPSTSTHKEKGVNLLISPDFNLWRERGRSNTRPFWGHRIRDHFIKEDYLLEQFLLSYETE